jgi:hypothetical protein
MIRSIMLFEVLESPITGDSGGAVFEVDIL